MSCKQTVEPFNGAEPCSGPRGANVPLDWILKLDFGLLQQLNSVCVVQTRKRLVYNVLQAKVHLSKPWLGLPYGLQEQSEAYLLPTLRVRTSIGVKSSKQ